MCGNFGEKKTTFAEVTQQSVEHSYIHKNIIHLTDVCMKGHVHRLGVRLEGQLNLK